MTKLDERIFWVNRVMYGRYETGTLLDADQLKSESTEFYGRSVGEGDFVNGDEKIAVEEYEDDHYYITELHSLEEVKSALTWEHYDVWTDADGLITMEKEYPDFVPKNMRVPSYISDINETVAAQTETLLVSGEFNLTVDKYMLMLHLTDEDIVRNYTKSEQMMMEIAREVDAGDITKDKYNAIISKYNLADGLEDAAKELDCLKSEEMIL